jgi:hypothetical protein
MRVTLADRPAGYRLFRAKRVHLVRANDPGPPFAAICGLDNLTVSSTSRFLGPEEAVDNVCGHCTKLAGWTNLKRPE